MKDTQNLKEKVQHPIPNKIIKIKQLFIMPQNKDMTKQLDSYFKIVNQIIF